MSISFDSSVLSSFFAGSVAGACGVMIGHPFDSLKVRMQVGQNLNHNKVDLFMIKQLYRGVITPLATVGAIQAINFSIYEKSKQVIHNRFFSGEPDSDYNRLKTVFFGGVCSGAFLSLLTTTPLGIIKLQMQVASEAGVFSNISRIMSVNGVRTLYRGYFSTFLMESPGRGVYLWSYEATKLYLHRFRTKHDINVYRDENEIERVEDKMEWSTRAMAAATAGIFSWFVLYPFDVIKVRMQLDINKSKFRNSWHCVMVTWREGGIRSLYRGLYYTLVRAGPVAAAVLPIYDFVKTKVDKALQEY